MRAVIVGPGAVGVWMGERLAAAGWTVSALARGATLAALKTHGLRVIEGGVSRRAPVIASDDPATLGPQDYVLVSLKAQALPEVAPTLAPLMHEGTAVVSAMNGIPWWFFQRFGGALEGTSLDSVDPGGRIAAALPPERVIGCVLHNSNFSPEPGVSQVAGIDRLIFGEPDGTASTRVETLAAAFRAAEVRSDTPSDIRTPIWVKLWGNMYANPISALTGAGTADMLADDLVLEMPPVTPSEDFSEFLAHLPGCFFFVGAGLADGSSGSHHEAAFAIDDRCVAIGASVLATAAVHLAAG